MSKSPIDFGIVVNGIFYSNRMQKNVGTNVPNGIYSMDMSVDDFVSTLSIADIDSAMKHLRKSSKFKVVKGISIHDCFVPENPVSYKSLPIKVLDATYDDFEEVEVAMLMNGDGYFIRIVNSNKSYALMDVKSAFEENRTLSGIKSVTPEMGIAFMFLSIEREEERRRLELQRLEAERLEAEAQRVRIANERRDALMEIATKRQEAIEENIRRLGGPADAIRRAFQSGGAMIEEMKKTNRGYEVSWRYSGHSIRSLIGEDLRVIRGGFCMSGYDSTQSATSLVPLLSDYINDGSHIYQTY